MRVRAEGPQLISEMVRKNLNMDTCVLMGANLAKVGTDVQRKENIPAWFSCISIVSTLLASPHGNHENSALLNIFTL